MAGVHTHWACITATQWIPCWLLRGLIFVFGYGCVLPLFPSSAAVYVSKDFLVITQLLLRFLAIHFWFCFFRRNTTMLNDDLFFQRLCFPVPFTAAMLTIYNLFRMYTNMAATIPVFRMNIQRENLCVLSSVFQLSQQQLIVSMWNTVFNSCHGLFTKHDWWRNRFLFIGES